MKTHITFLFLFGFILLGTGLLSAFTAPDKPISVSFHLPQPRPYAELKQEALEILEQKCNTCHRKQNPFMIFKAKNMEKRAPKIYEQVFRTRRMPKGNENPLSAEQYRALKTWLLTQNLN